MTLPIESRYQPRLILPPAFTGQVSAAAEDTFTQACRIAGPDGAGSLIVAEREDVLDLAVVFAPEEPLVSARRAFLLAMTALADAIGTHAAPEMPIAIDWADTLVFDGARLGGGRLGWPDGCAEEAVPDWLVFSAMLIASKQGGDPGLTPASTSLEEEGFSPETRLVLVESFACNLMKSFEVWDEDGFEPIAARYLSRLRRTGARTGRIDRNGDVVIGSERLALRSALTREPAWRDPASGTVRI